MLLNKNYNRQINDLASRLVSTLTDFDLGSLNHESCVEFSLSNFHYHRFLSPNSDQLSRQINGLAEKFFVHSQPEKSKCLKAMFTKFIESDLSKSSFSKSSVHYSLISLLLSLAEKPLYHDFQKSTKKCQVAENDDIDWTAYLLDGEDVPANFEWDESPYESDDSDVENKETVTVIQDEQKVQSLKSVNELALLDKPSFSKLVCSYWAMPKPLSKPTFKCSLKSSFLVLENGANIEETNVIREILWLLSGQKNLFVFPEKNGKHVVSPHACMSHLTNHSLQEHLNVYAQCGNIVAKLRKYVFSHDLHITSTYQAFASSLSLYLNKLIEDLIEIEKKVKLKEDTFLLQDLLQALSPHINVLQLLSGVYDSSIARDQMEENYVIKSSRLLGILYQSLLDEHGMHRASTNPAVELTTVDILFNLWLDSVKPYINIIDQWISKGILEDEKKEFVVSRKLTNCQQANFWNEAIVFSIESIKKFCPWLFALLPAITTGGKSMEILKTLNAMAKKSDASHSDVLSSVNDVLHQPVYDYFLDCLAITSSSIEETFNAIVVHEGSFGKKDALLKANFVKLLTPPATNFDSSSSKMDKHFVNAKPLSVLVTNSLQPVIDLKCNYANKRLVEVLKDHFELFTAVNLFHDFHLMALGDVMHHFAVNVCEHLLTSDSILNDLVGVNILMQEALSYNTTEHKVFVHLKEKTNEQKKFGGLTTTKAPNEKPSNHRSIAVTDCIELQWKVEWPVTLVLNERCIAVYNKVFSYLMQIKRALYSVESLKFSTIYHTPVSVAPNIRVYSSSDTTSMSVYEKQHRMAILRARILHLLQHWHSFVMTSVIQSEKHVFSLKFASAQTLDDILTAHNFFLERILSLCLLDESNQASKLVQGTLKKIMTLTITFNLLWNCGIDLIQERSLLKHESAFHECSEFLGRILKTIANRGSVPILDSLAYAILS